MELLAKKSAKASPGGNAEGGRDPLHQRPPFSLRRTTVSVLRPFIPICRELTNADKDSRRQLPAIEAGHESAGVCQFLSILQPIPIGRFYLNTD